MPSKRGRQEAKMKTATADGTGCRNREAMGVGGSGFDLSALDLFCARLRRLQVASGASQTSLARQVHIGTSQMSDILNGKIKRPPAWEVTSALVRACLEHAADRGRQVPPDLSDAGDWRRRYGDLESDLDAEGRPASLVQAQPGRVLSELSDPFSLEVHRPVSPGTAQPGLPALPGRQAEHDFLARYRRHVTEYHGMLEPPDFERRRRVPAGDLYVPPAIVQILSSSAQLPPRQVALQVFAQEIDRTVLLGDPGSGKTTAAHVLMHGHAADPGCRVPFLVPLREFSSGQAPARSVAGYLDGQLEAFYQCPAPSCTVERLFLSGSALVIFDGLDELDDGARRRDVTAIIERFSDEHPLARVLVTSRVAGYEKARLDDRQFARYRIGGFNDSQVAEYVRKWFAQEDGLTGEQAARQTAAFLAESASVPDLRANPLMLALMCILYRGEGSIPRNRPEVYEQCSILLLRRWDARRHIHVRLRARSQAEPATRHLAYWLFTRGQQPTVTERELLRETSAFLRDRGFEDPEQATH
jgi:NACHT domain